MFQRRRPHRTTGPAAASEPDEREDDASPAGPRSVKELRESPRRPGRYLLTLSDGRTLILGIGALADSGATRVGVTLTAEAVAGLVRESAITALVDRAVASIARGRRTRRELEQRLRQHEPEAALVAAALDRLEASGVLSDEEVARAEASARLRRGEAPARVRQLLRRKGVDDRLAGGAIAEAVSADGFDELTACRDAAARRARALASLEPEVARRRLMSFLGRRGFSGNIVRTVVQEMLGRGKSY